MLAFCSISYEFIIARAVSELTDDVILWQSVTIGIYVASLGVGSFWYGRLKAPAPGRILVRVEAGLTILGALSVLIVQLAHTFYRIYFYRYFTHEIGDGNYAFLVLTILFIQLETVAVGILSGFELPALLELVKRDTPETSEGTVLGAGYIGSLAGSLGFVVVLPRLIGLGATAAATAAVNGLACLAVIALFRPPRRMLWTGAAVGTLLVAALVGFLSNRADQLYLKNRYYNIGQERSGFFGLGEYLSARPDIQRFRTAYQDIDIVRNQFRDLEEERPFRSFRGKDYFTLYINRRLQFENLHEHYYHESMTHVPVMLTGRIPARVLILGGGDGLIARELLRYSEVKAITQVELDPEMARLALNEPRLTALNENSLRDPRVRLILGDAFSFARRSREVYDAVLLDFPYPHSYDVSKLYSVEFYRFVRARLAPDGFLVLDFPLFRRDRLKQYNDIIMSTLDAGGFSFLVPYGTSESFVLALPEPRKLDYRFRPPEFALRFLTPEIMRKIQSEHFGYRLRADRVNSVFKPQPLGNRGVDAY